MFEITVSQSFSSARSTLSARGAKASTHGHNFRVDVTARGRKLQPKVAYLADFLELKELLGTVVGRLDYTNLNTLEPFQHENPSAENLARYIYDQMAPAWRDRSAPIYSVTLWLTERMGARYIRE